jgi:hypothetical protein
MTTSAPDSALPFDVWHANGLLFDADPNLFVDFGHRPIIFTVRGLTYFAPRFKHVGFPIAAVNTKEQFESAYRAWLEVEDVLLKEKIANRSGSSNEYSALQAVIDGDADAFEAMVKKLEHRQRANLKIVKV